MHVSHVWQFLYLAVPKTGSRTLSTIFATYGAEVYEDYHSRNVPPCQDYDRIVSIRNPYTRMLSLYHHCKQKPHNQYHEVAKNMEFREFVPWIIPKTSCQVDFIGDFDPRYHIRLENLQEDLEYLPFIKPPVEIPHLNNSRIQEPWESFYDGETLKLVNEFAEKDFEQYGYLRCC